MELRRLCEKHAPGVGGYVWLHIQLNTLLDLPDAAGGLGMVEAKAVRDCVDKGDDSPPGR